MAVEMDEGRGESWRRQKCLQTDRGSLEKKSLEPCQLYCCHVKAERKCHCGGGGGGVWGFTSHSRLVHSYGDGQRLDAAGNQTSHDIRLDVTKANLRDCWYLTDQGSNNRCRRKSNITEIRLVYDEGKPARHDWSTKRWYCKHSTLKPSSKLVSQ